MTQEPFTIHFSATYPNAAYTDVLANAAQAGDDAKFKRFNINASELRPKAYINRLLEGNCLFSKVEVHIDGQTGMQLTQSSLEDKQMFYQSVHRTMDNSENRKSMYGSDIVWISNAKEREVKDAVAGSDYVPAVMNQAGTDVVRAAVQARAAQPIVMSEAMKVAVQSLTFDGKTSTMSGVLTAGFDGVFPFQVIGPSRVSNI
jgi:hypothetical protein